jgi:predicted transcriptional regulator
MRNLNNLRLAMNNSINWRRSKVLELSSQGYSQSDIAKALQISQPTISRDISYLEEQARNNIRKYIDKKLPFEYDKCLVALNSLQKKAWEISEKSDE